MNTIQLPERLPRVEKRVDASANHENVSEWLNSIEEKLREPFKDKLTFVK